jgi:hypothetical protein
MAQTAQINIDLNSKDAEKNLKSLNNEAKKTNQTFKAVDATFEEVYGDLKPLTARMGEAEDRLYELSLAGKQATAEYRALLKTVGEYRRTQIQTDMAVDAAALTITQKLTTGLGAAAGGFAVVEGAMAAVGLQSEGFEQVMQKLTGAIAAIQGINELRESLPVLQQMFGGLKNVSEAASESSNVIKDYGTAVVTAGAAVGEYSRDQKLFRAIQNSSTETVKLGTKELFNQVLANKNNTAAMAALRKEAKLSSGLFGIFARGAEQARVEVTALSQSWRILSTGMKLGVFALAAASIAGMVYSFKKLTATTEEDSKAQDRRNKLIAKGKILLDSQNESVKEAATSVANESAKYVLLVNQLKHTNAGSEERLKLINSINTQYGTTLKNLEDETAFQQQLNVAVNEYLNFARQKFLLSKYEGEVNKLLEKQYTLEADLKRLRDPLTLQTWNNETLKGGDAQERVNQQIAETEQKLTDVVFALDRYGKLSLKAAEQVENKYVPATETATKKTTELTQALKDLPNAFKIGDLDPTDAFPIDEFANKIIQAETKINKIRFDITGTFGNERLALEEDLRQAQLDLLELQLQQELKAAGNNADLKLKIESEYALKRYDILSQSSIKVTETEAEEAEKQLKWAEMTNEEKIALAQNYFDQLIALTQQATDLIDQEQQNRLDVEENRLEQRFTREQQLLDESLANRLISQEQYDEKVKLLEQRQAEEQKQLARRSFEQQKKVQIANATMNTAQAAVSAFANQPGELVAKAIAAAIATAFGAAQVAIIARQQFTAANGGIVPGKGPSNVDSVNSLLAPGEAVINANSTQAFMPLLSAINQAGGGKSLVPEVTSNKQIISIYNDNAQPLKAYVVERDITSSQQQANKFKRKSKLFN